MKSGTLPPRTWSGRTSWCMTGYHAACPGASTMLRPCTCECHTHDSKPTTEAA